MSDDPENEALSKLSEALGQPSQQAAEKAKALFPFVMFEAEMEESTVEGADPAVAEDDRTYRAAATYDTAQDEPTCGSVGRPPTSPGS